jgi:hypothetical protein
MVCAWVEQWARTPNVVVTLADDLGYGNVSADACRARQTTCLSHGVCWQVASWLGLADLDEADGFAGLSADGFLIDSLVFVASPAKGSRWRQ